MKKWLLYFLVAYFLESVVYAEKLDTHTLKHLQTLEEQKLSNTIAKPLFLATESLYDEYFGRASFVQELLSFKSSNILRDLPMGNIKINANSSDSESLNTNLQMGLKERLDKSFLGSGLELYASYTNNTSWQFLKSNPDKPVGVLTHNPQVYFNLPINKNYGDFNFKKFYFGYSYQMSNNLHTQSQENVNQLFAQATLGYGDIGDLLLKAWYYVPQEETSSSVSATSYGQFMLGWERYRHSLGITWYNRLKNSPNKGAFSLDYSMPFSKNFQLYFQYLGQYTKELYNFTLINDQIWARIVLVN